MHCTVNAGCGRHCTTADPRRAVQAGHGHAGRCAVVLAEPRAVPGDPLIPAARLATDCRRRRALNYCAGLRAGHYAGALTMRMLIIALLLSSCSPAFADSIPTDARRWQRDLTHFAQQAYGLQAPVSTLAAMIHQESR